MSDAILPCPTFDNGEFQLAITPAGDSFRVQAPSLARALGFRDAFRLMESIPDGEKGYTTACTPGGEQRIGYLTEAGFYRALGQRQPSRIKDEVIHVQVERFQSWVYSEVLPAIRRTGRYGADAIAGQVPQTLPEALRAYAREIEAREALEAYAMELEPKADAYAAFIDGDGTYSVGTVAKMLGLSQNKLFAKLRNAGVLIAKGAMRNTPYQQYMHHFAVKAYDYTRSDGTTATSHTTRVQPSGIDFIRRKIGVTTEVAS